MNLTASLRLVGCVIAAAAPGVSAQAGTDLLYNHRASQELPILSSYHKQPYWRALAECAGIHGVLVSRFEAAGMNSPAQEARDRGVHFLSLANARLKTDRGLSEKEALAITSPAVEAGRTTAEALLDKKAPHDAKHRPSQIVNSMCAHLEARHAKVSKRRP